MIAGMISGHTRSEVGKSQGYMGLAIRDEVVGVPSGETYPAMVTAWAPTPDELWKLAHGANVHVTLLGVMHPAIRVDVGELPEGGALGLTIIQQPSTPKESA